MDPPNIRANVSPTVDSSLRSIRAASPRWLPMPQRSPAPVAVYRRRKANDSPACRITHAWYRDTATLRHRENPENCIYAGQGRSEYEVGGH
ncbi:hypothetical protein NJB14197_17280 [Mycobacterium montefiorense]|uniref:Uncharacterized protein n=1 Tax=Mycobacterium montefiorense TaxID=154654 RepID=A0AA37PLS4_9MYCO|nr:hypothetical protein MmonteBS_53300 [Mycobacterium montefiorense]GKU35130.1 hypothetical protein NJB14191_24760 [Mycobacterium montefiorense]GKU40069.1 hypothetical protein NJB14192_20570 [Mycobacterium montefiorense]GKU47220.1 hypothetical protein NJB14194_38380 [Mycobacterium montefiorense]GKU49463.1 hypothetical protein NJB14195_07100 [Mycobacterium montefiorense]